MDSSTTASLKKGIFKWRSNEKAERAYDVDGGGSWRKYDVSVALALLMMTLGTIYKSGRGCLDVWETLTTHILEITLWLLMLWIIVRILRSFRPHLFSYKREYIADMFEQKEIESFQPANRSRGSNDSKEKLVDSTSTNLSQQMRPVYVDLEIRPVYVDSSSQTEGNLFLLDIKRTERCYQREMRRLRRQMWRTKRHMREHLKENCETAQNQERKLTDYQLRLLPLKARKEYLLIEKAKLDEELEKEQSCQQDLISRLTRIETQLLSRHKDHPDTTYGTDSFVKNFPIIFTGVNEECSKKVDLDSKPKTLGKPSPILEDTAFTGQHLSVTKTKQSKNKKQFSKFKAFRQRPLLKEKNAIRMLYSIERGDDEDMKYVQVTPILFPVYETGSELFPRKTTEQMEIIARPHPDGTLRVLRVSRYTDGFPRDVLDKYEQYIDVHEYQMSRGIAPGKRLNLSDLVFQTL